MTVLLRESTSSDLELVLAWRNSPLIWQGLYQQAKDNRPLTWKEHYKWYLSRHNWKQFIIQINDDKWTRDIGYINIAQLDNWMPEVSIITGEVTLWGRGIGKQALFLACDWLREQGYEKVHTTILRNNTRSIRLFESVGFEKVGKAREDEDEYSMYLKNKK